MDSTEVTEAKPTPTPGIPVTIGGKEYKLRYSWAARQRLIKLAGGEQKLKEGLKGELLMAAVLEGIKGGDSTTTETVESIGEAMDLREVLGVATGMAVAMGYKAEKVEESAVASIGEQLDPTSPLPEA